MGSGLAPHLKAGGATSLREWCRGWGKLRHPRPLPVAVAPTRVQAADAVPQDLHAAETPPVVLADGVDSRFRKGALGQALSAEYPPSLGSYPRSNIYHSRARSMC
jgi:hypothetical protein